MHDCETRLALCVFGTRPNGSLELYGSLELFGKNNAQHSTVGAALRSSPHQKGRYLTVITWAAVSAAPFCYWELFATILLTNGESISSLFRVEKDSIYLDMVSSVMADTDRRPVTLAVATWEFLDQLSKLGTHGTSVPDVAKTLIEEGIRQAIKDGFLKQRSHGPT
jgi:hypothetical protein